MTAPPAGWEVVASEVEGVQVWRPIPDDPRTVEAPEGGYRCPSCGAAISYDVAHGALACPHCDTTIAAEAEQVGHRARADEFTHEAIARASAAWRLDRPQLHCDGCGVDLEVEAGDLAARCAFCGSNRVLLREGVAHALRPSAVLPFAVDKAAVRERVRTWLGQGWMHPSDLASGAILDEIAGVYLPYWVFDARSDTAWECEVGIRKTRRVYRNGEWKTESYIDWEWRSGAVSVGLDAVEPGTDKVHGGLLRDIGDFGLAGLREYDPAFLAGWRAQAYDVGLEDAWERARRVMRGEVKQVVRRDIGHSRVRNLSVNADFTDERWRYVLLPVHLCAYSWEDRVFRIVVNGQTGALAGQRPVVWNRVYAVCAAMYAPALIGGIAGLLLLVFGVGVVVLVVALVLLLLAVGGTIWLLQVARDKEALS